MPISYLEKNLGQWINLKSLLIPTLLSLLLVGISFYSFIIFHTLAEFYSITIAIMATVVVWQTYRFTQNNYLIYLGCGYFWIGLLDLVHTFTFKGMNMLPVTIPHMGVQFWLGTRYLEAILLLTAPFYFARTVNPGKAIFLFGIVAFVLSMLVFTGNFPAGFVPGKGLTPFKIYSEYLIIAILIGAIVHHYKKHSLLGKHIYQVMVLAISLTILAEFMFTNYVEIYGNFMIVGHIFKIFSFWFVYIAVVRTTLTEPFAAMSKSETLYEGIPVATVIADSNGMIQHCNRAAAKLSDMPTGRLIGQSSHDFFHVRNCEPENCQVCRGVKAGLDSVDLELEVAEGKWYSFSVSKIAGGLNYIEVIRDITEQKLTAIELDNQQKQLVKSEARLREAQGIAHMGWWELDLIKNKLDWSVETHNIFETDRDSFKPSYEAFLKYVHPDDMEKLDKIYSESVNQKKSYDTTHRIVMPDGRVKYVREKGRTVYDGDKAVSTLGTVQDVTEQKLKEMQMHRMEKMDALGKLTGGVAHDFNNILGIISGYSGLLKNLLADNPKQQKFIEEVSKAAKRGARLTEKLLAFSRMESSRAESVSINELLSNEENILRKTLTPQISLDYQLGNDIWPVYMDASMFANALLNIAINAKHAMPDGGRFSISTQNVNLSAGDVEKMDIKPGSYVKLTFTDTGVGMDNETKEKIFDPFFTTKGEKGTGLGMSQVYGFVKQSDGDIDIGSEKGVGTTIDIYFPHYFEVERKNIKENDTQSTEITMGNETILIVDDEDSLLELNREILSTCGYKVLCAHNGDEALELLKNNKIHLVLSDIVMPGMSGHQLAAEIKEHYPDVKIQIMSGFTERASVDEKVEDLHDKRLQKPFSSEYLLDIVRELLDSKA